MGLLSAFERQDQSSDSSLQIKDVITIGENDDTDRHLLSIFKFDCAISFKSWLLCKPFVVGGGQSEATSWRHC